MILVHLLNYQKAIKNGFLILSMLVFSSAALCASCATGSYAQSCTNASCSGTTLTATCKTFKGKPNSKGGKPIPSNIDVSKCKSTSVKNVNGKLTCG